MQTTVLKKTKEHPILFTGEMVRAILTGLKTQTRRVIKPPPGDHPNDDGYNSTILERCPYGEPGDLLWVRETWRPYSWHEGEPIGIEYKADGFRREILDCPAMQEMQYEEWDERMRIALTDECQALKLPTNENGEYCWEGDSPLKWRPSIHLPRWASRISLTNKKVRVERVQDITPEDVIAEGVTIPVTSDRRPLLRITGDFPPFNYYNKGDDDAAFIRANYASLWDQINHKRGFGWNVNPWLWVIDL